jgi:hypothetical protein
MLHAVARTPLQQSKLPDSNLASLWPKVKKAENPQGRPRRDPARHVEPGATGLEKTAVGA